MILLKTELIKLRIDNENDATRSRNFFEHHLKYLLPLKRKWFIKRDDTDVLNVDNLTKDEKCKAVEEWIDRCIKKYSNQ